MEHNENTAEKVEDISKRLSGESSLADQGIGDGPKAAEPQAFDLSKLSPEQLQQLKAMLNSTPDRVVMKQTNPIILLRRYQEKFISEIQNAFTTLQKDDLTNITSEVIMLPVKFIGEDVFVNIPWKDFMNAEQVECEVVSIRKVEGRIVEGKVVSKETGRLVEREVKTVETYLTVKLPDGNQVELEAKIANA